MLTFRISNYILFAGLLVLNILQFTIGISGWFYLGWGMAYMTVISIGSFRVGSNFHFKVSCRADGQEGVFLTYDDGPHPETTPRLLDLLKEERVRAAFFLVGKNAEEHPEIVQRMITEGHVVANHTYGHSHFFDFFAPYIMAREFRKTRSILHSITGLTVNWFRPPFGVTNPMMTRALKMEPHHVVGWSVRSLDTVIKNRERLSRRLDKAGPGDIVLLHDTLPATLETTKELLRLMKEKGLKAGNPHQMLDHPPYLTSQS